MQQQEGDTIMPRGNPALSKPLNVSAELEAVVGKGPMARGQVVKKLWEYIKSNNLQNPTNKRNIKADDKLKPIFGVAGGFRFGEQGAELLGGAGGIAVVPEVVEVVVVHDCLILNQRRNFLAASSITLQADYVGIICQ